jgi:hypothetical protein
MVKGEPRSPRNGAPELFLIGQNKCGNWVIQDMSGLRGGLFITQSAAVKFAKAEAAAHSRAMLILTSEGLELDMNTRLKPLRSIQVNTGRYFRSSFASRKY